MPCTANEAHRHKVANWPDDDRALRQRGSLTVWVTPEAPAAWQPPRTGQRGRPRDHSDVAIETGHLPRSITVLLGIDVGLPDHTPAARCAPPACKPPPFRCIYKPIRDFEQTVR